MNSQRRVSFPGYALYRDKHTKEPQFSQPLAETDFIETPLPHHSHTTHGYKKVTLSSPNFKYKITQIQSPI